MYKGVLEKVRKEASGTNAKNIVADLTRFHRIQASSGFREAAEYCEGRFRENGLASVEILEFPGDGKQMYWSYKMPKAWFVREAELRIVSPKKAQRFCAALEMCPCR